MTHPTPREGVSGLPAARGRSSVFAQLQQGRRERACWPRLLPAHLGRPRSPLCCRPGGGGSGGSGERPGPPDGSMAPGSPGPRVRSAAASAWSRAEEAARGGKRPRPLRAPATGAALRDPLDVAPVTPTPVGGARRGAGPPSLGEGQKPRGKHSASRHEERPGPVLSRDRDGSDRGSRRPPGVGRPTPGCVRDTP